MVRAPRTKVEATWAKFSVLRRSVLDRRELMLPLTVIQPQRRRQSRAAYAGEPGERTLDGTPQQRLLAAGGSYYKKRLLRKPQENFAPMHPLTPILVRCR